MSEVITKEPEQEKVFKWRLCWLLSAGFSAKGAEKIANRTDVHVAFACRTMDNAKRKGYDEAFVIDLLT